MKVVVLYNAEEETKQVGSGESAVVHALRQAGHEVALQCYEENMTLPECDVVFNLCDTFTNSLDEYKVAEKLDSIGVPYTGCGAFALRHCISKVETKHLLHRQGVLVPKFQVFDAETDALKSDLKFPLIVKPSHEDASIGIEEDSVVFDEQKLRKKVAFVVEEYKQPALAEEYVDGREFCVPVIGNEPRVMPILEIDYSQHFEGKPKILSFKAKWSKNSNAFKNTYSVIAKDIAPELRERIRQTAARAYAALQCSGYATVDMRVDAKGNVFVLEVNPNSYISWESDQAKAAKEEGLDYPTFLTTLLHFAVQKHGKIPIAVRA